jgi:phosphoglycolate/pyridoxal phosphate phosphatase family enzyme
MWSTPLSEKRTLLQELKDEHSLESAPRQVDAYDAYVFDMDGTIYLGDSLLPGVEELIANIQRAGRKHVFLTNNPTKTREHYADKLSRLGLPTSPDQVVTSATLTAAWLKRTHPDAVCFVLGEQPLMDALISAGIRLSDKPSEITMVIASYDRTLDYRKLQIAFDSLWSRPDVHLIATHPDAYCPFPGGKGEPDAAAITAAIEASTGRTCEEVLGKPSPEALETALRIVGVDMTRALMVGDRLKTDIAMGVAAGAATALVLTGDSTRQDVESTAPDQRPTYVLESIQALSQPLEDEASRSAS